MPSTVWQLEPHTRAKHEILVEYLKAWFGILGSTRWHNRAIVLDGFSGPGVYAGGEAGSPILAMQTLLEHSHFDRWGGSEFVFLFNEQDPARHESLETTLDLLKSTRSGTSWPSNVKVHTRNQAFSELAEELLAGMAGAGKKLAPTFAFIDPFGYKDIPIELIQRLLRFDACELFIYFDFNSVNRFGTAGIVDRYFDALFGTDEYRGAPASGPERGQFLHDLYERQLKEVCNFAHVRSFKMVNRSGHIGNYLFFCTRNTQAFDRMKQAMWKAAPGGDYSFADRLAGQDVLFEENASTRPLQAALLQHFAGRTVTIQEVTNFVICSTPYHSSHVKRATLAPMQKGGLITGGHNQKREGQFPDGTLIVFPPQS